MSKSLLEKISQIIDEHINEIIDLKIDNKIKSERQHNKDLIKKEIMLFSKEKENMYTDIFGVECMLSDMTKDHIMPIDENGSNIALNILWICESSNKIKANKLNGVINNIEYKVAEGKNLKIKSKFGVISTNAIDNKRMLPISTKKENLRFKKFQENI